MQRIENLFAGANARRPSTWVKPILLTTLLSWLPAQAIEGVVITVLPGPEGQDIFMRPFDAIALVIFIGPVLETYGMRGLFGVLGKFIRNRTALNGTSSVLWGALHWETPTWGLHAVWAFYIMGICFLTLREKDAQMALYVTMIIHGCFNALCYGAYQMLQVA